MGAPPSYGVLPRHERAVVPTPKKVKLAVKARDGWRCRLCGVRRTLLHVHHIDGRGDNSPQPNHTLDNLVTLCRACHDRVHHEGVLLTPELLARAERVRTGAEVLIARPVDAYDQLRIVGSRLSNNSGLHGRPEKVFFINHPEEDE